MKQAKLLSVLAASLCLLCGCGNIHAADVYTVSVDPYKPLNEEDIRFGECSIQFGDEVSVNGQGAWYKDKDILISEGGIYTISGSYSGGCINITTTDAVKLIFSNADISNPDGYAVISDAEKLILTCDGTSCLTGCGGDMSNAVYSDGIVLITGLGDMCIDGGIFSKGGIRFGREVSAACEIMCTDDGDIIPGVFNIN